MDKERRLSEGFEELQYDLRRKGDKGIKATASGEDEQRRTVQWENLPGSGFTPCARTSQRMPSGVYSVAATQMGIIFKKTKLHTDDLLRFKDPTHETIIGEIDKFWDLRKNYNEFGFLHNRALLMWGPPGSGKSCIAKIVVSDVVGRDNIVFNCNDVYLLTAGLKAFREVEPDRQCMVLMEDIDSIHGEARLLSLLDGEDTVDNILYLATTNYIENIPDRVLRPGRFDRKIYVPHPPKAGRVAYLQKKLKDPLVIQALAEATKGLSFAHLRELLIGIYCLGQPKEDVIKRLKSKKAEHLGKRTPEDDLAVETKLVQAIASSEAK